MKAVRLRNNIHLSLRYCESRNRFLTFHKTQTRIRFEVRTLPQGFPKMRYSLPS